MLRTAKTAMAQKDPPQIFGIQELYRPMQPAEIDIVAVHGLNGDALKTWTSEPEKICWLSHPDFLPKYVKNARVLSWGYNANISSLTGATPSSDRILQHAQTLVAQLHADRDLEDANDRPIIFVCHSLGGIIVKRALAYSFSRNASKTTHLHSIYTCTFGLLFFGTPHFGTDKAKLLGSLQRLASLSIPTRAVQFSSSLVSALESESETLQNITDAFAPLLPRFRVFFFWEQEMTELGYKRDYIVDEASAAPILDDTERCGVSADHRGMVKFRGNGEVGFRTAVAALRRYCKDAPQVVGARAESAREAVGERRRREAVELLAGVRTELAGVYRPGVVRKIESLDARKETWDRVGVLEGERLERSG